MSRLFSTYLLGISFKIRFYKRYSTQLGRDVWFREKNRMRRQFAFQALIMQDQVVDDSRVIICQFLQKRETTVTLLDGMEVLRVKIQFIAKSLKQRYIESGNRLLSLKEIMQRECTNLKMFYERASKDKNRKKAGTKFLKLLEEIDLGSKAAHDICLSYQKKLQIDHMLDYCIYHFCKAKQDIQDLTSKI